MSAAPLAIFALMTLPWTPPMGDPGSRVVKAPVTSEVAQSQSPQAQDRETQMRFRSMDTNGDNIITRDEWRGSAQSFRVHDWNRDGVLSGSELRVASWRNENWENMDYDSQYEIDDWTASNFARLDRNGDNRITRNEWYFDAETFRRVDRNGDNVITRSEFLGAADYDDDRGDRFEYIDADGSGYIERDEWHGTMNAFDRLDTNRDNRLSRAEVVGGTVSRTATTPSTNNRARQQFESLDRNNNNMIARNEWPWSRASFDKYDVNGDGMLTWREFSAAASTSTSAVAPASTGGQTVRVDARVRWTDSGIYVRAGDTINFHAEGVVQMSPDANDTATPEGSRVGRKAPDAPARDQAAGRLLARIGDSGPLVLGPGGQWRAATSGELYFGINDDHLPDNSGEFKVTVNVIGR
ncbi:MAG TPA: hypothetical protein VEK56_13650 [Vicinamibacterales bacterium]|nr:hypothetical protein [Vicinamibacterales bacterium]